MKPMTSATGTPVGIAILFERTDNRQSVYHDCVSDSAIAHKNFLRTLLEIIILDALAATYTDVLGNPGSILSTVVWRSPVLVIAVTAILSVTRVRNDRV